MNKEAILSNHTEAAEQLASTIEQIKIDPDYDIEEYRVEMGHVYHHLNTAWNGLGARNCLLISGERWDDREWLSELVRITAEELPRPKKARK